MTVAGRKVQSLLCCPQSLPPLASRFKHCLPFAALGPALPLPTPSPASTQVPTPSRGMRGKGVRPGNEAILHYLHSAFAASDSDLLDIAACLVASSGRQQPSGLCLASHVLQEVEMRQHIRELTDTTPGTRRRRAPIASEESFTDGDRRNLRDMETKLVQIQQTGTRVTQGLAGLVLVKVQFLLEERAW